MALAEDLEEELGASLGEWHIAEFVDDDSLSGRRRAPERVLTNGGTFMFMTERGGPMTADALNRILFADEARFGRIDRHQARSRLPAHPRIHLCMASLRRMGLVSI
jgi:hypothetical protein